jgi:hypothetical protein
VLWGSGRKRVLGPRRVVVSFQVPVPGPVVGGLGSVLVGGLLRLRIRQWGVGGLGDVGEVEVEIEVNVDIPEEAKKSSSTCHLGSSNSFVAIVARRVSQ